MDQKQLVWICKHINELNINKDSLLKMKRVDRVVNFSTLYYFHGGITSIDKLTSTSEDQKYDLIDMLNLWSNGFSYNNFPVLSYLHYGNGKQEIAYYNQEKDCIETIEIESKKHLFPEDLLLKIIHLRIKDICNEECEKNINTLQKRFN